MLALALAERSAAEGASLAATRRPEGFPERLTPELASGSALRPVVNAIVADPGAAHTVGDLARARRSPSDLTRVGAEMGFTQGPFVEGVRVEAARDLLEASRRKL